MRTSLRTSDPAGLRARADELLAAARRESRVGSATRAWESAIEAAELGRELGDAEIVAYAATALRGPDLVSWEHTAARQALCLEALARLGPEPSDLRTFVAEHLAAISTAWTEDARAPTELILPAEAERRFIALQAEHARAMGPAGIARRLEIAARLITLGRAAADDDILSWGWLWRADALIQLGLRGEFSDAVAALTAAIGRSGAPAWRWRRELIAANLALIEDRRSRAEEAAASALEMGRTAGMPDAEQIFLFFRTSIAARNGRGLDALESDVAEALGGAPHFVQGWRAEILAWMGRDADAIAIWRTIAPRLPALPPHASEWLIACATCSELAILADDRESATYLMEAIAPMSHLHVAATATTPYRGPVAFVLGRLSAYLGDREAAASWFADAERRAGLMGATWQADAARRALAELREPRTPLSPRESEVADLVADGASNRQIAERLFLSERTVEQHVRSILRKLDAPNRSAVASWVSRRQG